MTMDHRTPCGAAGPYFKPIDSVRRPTRVPLTCNRPAGHEGNHIWRDDSGAQMAAWAGLHAPVKATAKVVCEVPHGR